MAVRMILLVCLGNIYPGARSQLGGSGKWVITVSGCSPSLSCSCVLCCKYIFFCWHAEYFFRVDVIFPVLQRTQYCVYWVVVGGVITGNVFPPLPPIDSYLSLEFLHPKVCYFERCLFAKRIQGILLSLTAPIKQCAHHIYMNKRMQSVSNANLLDRTNVSQAVLFCPQTLI